MSANDIDWKLFVICQRGENLLEIWKLGEVDDFDWHYVAEYENDGTNFLKSFKENDAKYHHDCASKYSTQKMKRILEKRNSKKKIQHSV